jgi:hypothetical protein
MTPIRVSRIVCSLCALAWAGAAEIHVATTGDDAGAGTSAKPFKTIQKAAEAAKPGDTVTVHAGTYRETVTPKASGTAEAPITFRPAKGEKVLISGTEIISGWKKDADGSFSASVPAGQYVSVCNYADQIFVNGVMLLQARYPNTPHDQLSFPRQGVITGFTSKTRDDAAKWTTAVWEDANTPFATLGKNLVGAQVTIQPSFEMWSWTLTGTVQATEATANGGTRFTTRSRSNNGTDRDQGKSFDVGGKYFVFDLPVLLDAAGEWYHDRAAGVLHVRPPEGVDLTSPKTVVEVRRRDFAFNLDKQAFITVQGFNLFGCTLTTDTLANGKGFSDTGEELYSWHGADNWPEAHHIIVDGLNVLYPSHYTDQSGHFINTFGCNTGLVIGGSDCVVQNCTVQYSAGNGISLFGKRNKALHNTILDASYNQQDGAGIATTCGAAPSIDEEIGWNTICRTGRSGITARNFRNSVPGSGVARIHHNDVSHFLIQDADGGGLYTYGGNGTFPRIDHNKFYRGYNAARGIYLDLTNGFIVDHNLVWDVDNGLYLLVGNEMIVYNNTLIARYCGFDYGPKPVGGTRDASKNCVMVNNLGITQQPTPAGGDVDQFYAGAQPLAKSNNIYWDGKYGSATDPKVVDIRRNDYRPTKDSPARGTGIVVPDFSVTLDGKTIALPSYNDAPVGKPNIGCFEGEFEAVALPAPNLAAGKPVTASSSKEDREFGAAKLTDGILNSTPGSSLAYRSTSTPGKQHREWVQIDLGAPTALNRIDVFPRNDGPTAPWGWDGGNIGRGVPAKLLIEASDDAEFKTGVTKLALDESLALQPHAWSYDVPATTARYVRLTALELTPHTNDKAEERFYFQLGEIEIYGPIAKP